MRQKKLPHIPRASLRELWRAHKLRRHAPGFPRFVKLATGAHQSALSFQSWSHKHPVGRWCIRTTKWGVDAGTRVGIGVIVVFVLLYLLSPTGITSRLVSEAMGVGSTNPGPPSMSWSSTPLHPLVVPGMKDDGSFDYRRMLSAWRYAGVSPETAMDVSAEVLSNSYATLFLVQDPIKSSEMSRDQQEWIEQGRSDAEIGVAMDRLAVAKPGLSAPPGSFSDEVVWETLNSSDYLLSRLGPGAPFPVSWEDRWRQWNAMRKSLPVRQRPHTPVALVVGLDKKGVWSARRMLESWRIAGLSPAQAEYSWEKAQTLLQDWERFESGSASWSKNFERALAASHALSSTLDPILGKRFPHMALIEPATSLSMASFDHTIEGAPPPSKPQQWSEHQTNHQWEMILQGLPNDKPLAPPPPDLTMFKAKREIERVASRIGLRSLTLSMDIMSSPRTLWHTAQVLERANLELEEFTGWSGPVLGLGGRVDLELRDAMSVEGAVIALPDGRMRMISTWAALSHEWFHALDLLAGQAALARPRAFFPLTAGSGWAEGARLPEVIAAARDIELATQGSSVQWSSARDQSSDPVYWNRSSEAAAFAFESVLSRQATGVLSDPSFRTNRVWSPESVPTDADLDRFQPLYQRYFRSMDGLDWTGRAGTATHNPTPARWPARMLSSGPLKKLLDI